MYIPKNLKHDYVLIEQIQEKTGRIILADEAKSKSLIGRIVLVGEDIDDNDLKKNEIVFYDSLNATPFQGYHLIQYQDIISMAASTE